MGYVVYFNETRSRFVTKQGTIRTEKKKSQRIGEFFPKRFRISRTIRNGLNFPEYFPEYFNFPEYFPEYFNFPEYFPEYFILSDQLTLIR